MEMVGKEEARLAVEENNVNENGIPLIYYYGCSRRYMV